MSAKAKQAQEDSARISAAEDGIKRSVNANRQLLGKRPMKEMQKR